MVRVHGIPGIVGWCGSVPRRWRSPRKVAGASCLRGSVRAAPARPGGRNSGSSRNASRSGVFLPSEPSGSSHIPAPSIIFCLRSLVDLLGGLGDRLKSSDIACADWYPAYAIINFYRAKGQGCGATVGKCNNLLYCPVFLEPGWCRVLPSCPSEKGAELSPRRVVSGSSGPERRGLGLLGPLGSSFLPSPSLSVFFSFCPDSLVLDS